MTKESLENWRRFGPPIIAAALTTPYFMATATSVEELAASHEIFVPFISLVLGALYVGLDLRSAHWKAELRQHIGPQIQQSLLSMLPADLEVTDAERATLSKQDLYKPLTGVFWEAVNADPQLTALKEHFYANGALYTTAIDVYILATVASICYLSVHVATQKVVFLVIAICLVITALISRYAILPKYRKRHLSLSEEQLDLLRRNQGQFVEQRFRELVLARRREGLLG